MSLLKVEDIHVYYGSIHAIKGVSFEVNEGEIVTLIGANGAGKSTTLNTISGLLKPRSGSIVFEDKNIVGIGASKIVSLGMALYIRREVAKEAQASGQALLSVFCYGLARVLGAALGGAAARAFGEAGGFVACALLCFSSLAIFFPMWKEAFCNSRRDML